MKILGNLGFALLTCKYFIVLFSLYHGHFTVCIGANSRRLWYDLFMPQINHTLKVLPERALTLATATKVMLKHLMMLGRITSGAEPTQNANGTVTLTIHEESGGTPTHEGQVLSRTYHLTVSLETVEDVVMKGDLL